MSGCSHGKTFKEPCTECQLVLAREGLAWALQSVEKYSKLITELSPDMSGPWIEQGTGWAKIHNLPPTHLLNEPQEVQVRDAARFLLDRLDEFDPGDFQAERDFHGHVAPAISRLKSALSLTRPSPQAAKVTDEIRKIINSAMAWQPSENGPSYDQRRNELFTKLDAALALPSLAPETAQVSVGSVEQKHLRVLRDLAIAADTAELMIRPYYPGEAASLRAKIRAAKDLTNTAICKTCWGHGWIDDDKGGHACANCGKDE